MKEYYWYYSIYLKHFKLRILLYLKGGTLYVYAFLCILPPRWTSGWTNQSATPLALVLDKPVFHPAGPRVGQTSLPPHWPSGWTNQSATPLALVLDKPVFHPAGPRVGQTSLPSRWPSGWTNQSSIPLFNKQEIEQRKFGIHEIQIQWRAGSSWIEVLQYTGLLQVIHTQGTQLQNPQTMLPSYTDLGSLACLSHGTGTADTTVSSTKSWSL